MRQAWLAVGVLGFALVATWYVFDSPRQKRIPHIGFLGFDSRALAPQVAALEEGLREFGYTDGHNTVTEYRWAEGQSTRLPALAMELVAAKVDVIACD